MDLLAVSVFCGFAIQLSILLQPIIKLHSRLDVMSWRIEQLEKDAEQNIAERKKKAIIS